MWKTKPSRFCTKKKAPGSKLLAVGQLRGMFTPFLGVRWAPACTAPRRGHVGTPACLPCTVWRGRSIPEGMMCRVQPAELLLEKP